MADDDAETPIPMGMVMFKELELIGSHGMQAHAFGPMLDMITTISFDGDGTLWDYIKLERL